MSSSRSRSSRGSRASSSTGRRRRASSDGLRKHVLKKNHLLSEKLTPRRPSVFDLTGEQIIRIKRTVSIGDDAIAIFTTVFVYDSQLTTNQFDETQGKLKDVELDKYFRPEQNRNPMETISQTVSYTAKMIKLTRTTTLDKKYLDQEWKMEETRGIREGFVSRLALDKEMPTSIGSRNQSTCTEADGYKNETFLIFSFDDDGAVKGLMLKAHYRKREERPDMEHCILLESNVKHGTNAVTMFLDAHLKPKVSELETGSYVEEIRQYKFNPSKSQLNELETTYKSTPGIKNTSNDKIVYWSTPSTKKSHYMSSDLNDSPSISSSVHPIAIPGPQSHEKVPRLKLPDTPETDVQTAVLLHSPLKKVEKIEAGVTLPVEDLTMSVEVSKVEDKTRKHTLILSAEIGGKQYEFTANIHWNRGPKDFIPKRVLIDGNNIWQQSKDWNPSSSVTRSQINMSSNDTK